VDLIHDGLQGSKNMPWTFARAHPARSLLTPRGRWAASLAGVAILVVGALLQRHLIW